MRPLTARWLGAYVVLLLALSFLGTRNQTLYQTQRGLIAEKTALQEEIKILRATAAPINGALAIPKWAAERGMIPASQAKTTRQVAPLSAPELPVNPGGVTLKTRWTTPEKVTP